MGQTIDTEMFQISNALLRSCCRVRNSKEIYGVTFSLKPKILACTGTNFTFSSERPTAREEIIQLHLHL